VAYITAEARQQLLDAVAGAVDDIGVALAALGAAYEQLDDFNADKLESELFGPIQLAYGRAKRTYAGFAERYDLSTRAFEPAVPGHPSQGVRGFLDSAAHAAGEADAALAALQDSMMPIEVGDPELRAGLAEVRSLLAGLPGRTREFVRLLGR
jgi:hypothetical protein